MRSPAVRSVGLGVSLLPVVTALAASAALLVDYTHASPVYCKEGGGCDALRHTVVATPLGVPLPLWGLLAFLVLGVVALLPGTLARLAQLVLSAVAAVAGIGLLLAQVHFHAFCPFCAVADASGIACAAAAAARLRLGLHEARDTVPWPASATGVASLLAAVLVPLVVGMRASPTPQVIRDEMAATPRGEVTLVDFVDFECPFCRMTHAELQPLVREHPGKVRIVRRQVPLASHPHARDAARAACCGEQLGKGDTMADALFAAPVDDLTPEGCEHIAQKIGLSLPAYRACVTSPATEVRIETDRAEFKAAGGFALPTLWIDDGQLVGAQTREALGAAIGQALAHAGS